MKNKRFAIALIMMILMSPFSVAAQEKISVAVAANFISAFKEIAADFEKKTGVKAEGTFSSTGNLYSQIKNGAPYDVFLSADLERPDILQKEGWTEGSFIYAREKLILWSPDKKFCKAASWPEAPDIVQTACVAKNAENKKGAELFAVYLLSEHASKIKQKYGYH